MAGKKAETVKEYLDALPKERRDIVSKVRALVRKNVPDGYKEMMVYGAISYAIPLDVFPDTYNGYPLCYVSIAAHKNYFSLYLMGAYGDMKQQQMLKDAYKKAGKKLDMGKACLRFRTMDDLETDVIATIVGHTPPSQMIAWHQSAHSKS
jgi:Domain of unknown function (DU1801)